MLDGPFSYVMIFKTGSSHNVKVNWRPTGRSGRRLDTSAIQARHHKESSPGSSSSPSASIDLLISSTIPGP